MTEATHPTFPKDELPLATKDITSPCPSISTNLDNLYLEIPSEEDLIRHREYLNGCMPPPTLKNIALSTPINYVRMDILISEDTEARLVQETYNMEAPAVTPARLVVPSFVRKDPK